MSAPIGNRSPRLVERAFLLFALALVLLIGIFAYGSWVAFRRSAAQAGIARQVIEETNVLLSSLTDAETGQRGFLLTGDESYLEPYKHAVTEIFPALDRLERIETRRHNTVQLQHIGALRPLVRNRVDELAQTIELGRNQGVDAAIAVVRSNRGNMIMGQIRVVCADIVESALDLSTRLGEKAGDRARETGLIAVVGSTAIFVILSFATIAIERASRRRLALIASLEVSEKQLRTARDLLETTIASIADAVITTDDRCKIVLINPVAQLLTGWSKAEAVGRPLEEVLVLRNEATGRDVENPAAKALREGSIVGLGNQSVLLGKDGREFPIDDSASPIRDASGNTFGAVLVFRDATDRRRAEEVRGRLAAIVEAAQDPIFSYGLDGIIRTWNRGAERLLGYMAEEIVGKPSTVLVPPERLHEEAETMERLHRGEAEELLDTVRVSRDGRRINVSVRVTPILDPEGRVIGASKILRDISEHKRLEEEIRRANASLESRVAERTEELSKTIAELERFAYTVAHDLRAPLRSIHRYSELVLDSARGLPPEAAGHLRRVVSEATRMDQLLGDLLRYSRVGLSQPHWETLDLDRLVDEAVAVFAGQIEERGAEVKVSGFLPPVRGDRVLLSQILANLLSNALKFVPPDRKPQVRIEATMQEGVVRVGVQDNGIGIPSGQQDRIFRLFERLHGGDSYEGTGVGLAIVARAAERMGGRVGYESEVGNGSRFWVELKTPARS